MDSAPLDGSTEANQCGRIAFGQKVHGALFGPKGVGTELSEFLSSGASQLDLFSTANKSRL